MTIGTGYLYYGAHFGATTTTKYGMYLTGEQYNYFSGNVGIGNTTPAFKLRVDGTTSLAGAVSGITTLAAGNTTITGFMNVSSNLMVGSAPTTLPSALATIVSGTTVGQNYQISLSPADGALGRESGIRFGATFSQGWGGVDFVSRYSGAISYGAAGGGATPRLHAMKFYTGDGSDVPTERVRIDASGNVGIGTTSPAYTLQVNGSFAATTKSFVIDHPTKPDMKLRYGSLEGPENGVYVRGRLDNQSVIELPEYWWNLVNERSITVNLTAMGRSQDLWVQSVSSRFVHLNQLADCFFTVFAERKDVDRLVVEF
jgi:hypothetical protein